MSDDPCVFCDIVADRAPAQVVGEWIDALAIEPLNPVVEGHVIVISRQHLTDASEDCWTTGMMFTRAVMLAKRWGLRDYNLITSRGTAATQTVMHLHIHLVPRSAGDGLTLPWTRQEFR